MDTAASRLPAPSFSKKFQQPMLQGKKQQLLLLFFMKAARGLNKRGCIQSTM